MNRKFDNLFSSYAKEKFLSKKLTLPFLYFLAVFIIAYFLLFYTYPLVIPKIAVGDIATENIVAPKTVTYTDLDKTNELRQKVAESTQSIYNFEPQKQNEILNNEDKFFKNIESVLAKDESDATKLQLLISYLDNNTDLALIISKSTPERLELMKADLSSITLNLLINGIRSDNLDQAIKEGYDQIKKTNLTDNEKTFVNYCFKKYIQPNLIFDAESTEKTKQDAMKSVPPVKVTVPQGSIVVIKGDKVTDKQIQILTTLGLIRGSDYWKGLLIFIFVVALFSVISILSLRRLLNYKQFSFGKKILELIITFGIVCVTFYLTKNISAYLIPIPLFAMIIFEFTDFVTALTLTIGISFIFSFPLDVSSFIILSSLVSVIMNLYALKKTNKIISFVYAGIIGGILFGIMSFAYGIVTKDTIFISLSNMTYGFANFFVSTVASIGIVFIMEHLFNEITIMRLLELSDTNNPLLRELLLKAPGTYQHSMLVANIAGSAADSIGADPLLTKVGSYYHDIGKMAHPYFFTENQGGIPNIHNSLSPNLSKTVITNHVKDGIVLARSFRLPQEIIDCIETHHGKTIVTYFYHKAKELQSSVSRDDYRYPGPLPRTRETAILFFADAVEAASHSLDVVDYRKIEELVNTIVDERVKDGQLDESDVTFSDLKKIKDSLVKSLVSMYHKREKYPDENTNNGQNKQQDKKL